MPTCVAPAAVSQSRNASSSRLTVRNVRTSLRARAPAAPVSRQATTVSWCTSSPQHRSMSACIRASLPQKATVTPQVGSRHCHTCSPFPGATKNSTSMQRGPDCLSGSKATQNVSASTRSPIQGSDKPTRAATIFIHNGARPAQLGCLGRVDGFCPNKGASEGDESGKVLRGFLAAQRDPLEALEPANTLLDTGAAFVEGAGKEFRLDGGIAAVRDDGTDTAPACRFAVCLAVIALVADHRPGRDIRADVEQGLEITAVAGLAAGQVEGQRQTVEIALQVNFG